MVAVSLHVGSVQILEHSLVIRKPANGCGNTLLKFIRSLSVCCSLHICHLKFLNIFDFMKKKTTKTQNTRLLVAPHFVFGDLSLPALTVLEGNQQNFRRGDPSLGSGRIALSVSSDVKPVLTCSAGCKPGGIPLMSLDFCHQREACRTLKL